jgi:hypothetical protein
VWNSCGGRHRGVLWMSLALAVLTALIGYALWRWVQADSLPVVQAQLARWLPLQTALQWAAIALIALRWHTLIGRLVRRGWISGARGSSLRPLRWRAVGWLVVLQWGLGQGGLVRLVGFIGGYGS